jgi:hypothetical protein
VFHIRRLVAHPHRHYHLVDTIADRLAVVTLQHVAIALDDVADGIGEIYLGSGSGAAIQG